MFRLEKEFRFEAAHHLPFHTGKCVRVHGHSWVGRIVCEGESLYKSGSKTSMLLDYEEMSAAVVDIVTEYLDHHDLNVTLKPFGIDSPTSEVIAQWLFERLKTRLPLLTEVWIEETCTCRCVYHPTVPLGLP